MQSGPGLQSPARALYPLLLSIFRWIFDSTSSLTQVEIRANNDDPWIHLNPRLLLSLPTFSFSTCQQPATRAAPTPPSALLRSIAAHPALSLALLRIVLLWPCTAGAAARAAHAAAQLPHWRKKVSSSPFNILNPMFQYAILPFSTFTLIISNILVIKCSP